MRLPRLLRTSSFRLTLLYTLTTAICFVVMFAVMVLSATHYMKEQIDGAVQAELREIEMQAQGASSGSLLPVIDSSTKSGNGFRYALVSPNGERISGDLPVTRIPSGLVESLSIPASGTHPAMTMRGICRETSDGGWLVVLASDQQINELQEFISRSFLLGAVVALALVLLAGSLISAASLRRIEQMSQSSRDIVHGDLAQRIPLNGSGDEFDHLAASLNAMLDRITGLMRSMQQVSVDVAHDLRTPLSRLRQKLELVHERGASPAQLQFAVAESLEDIDDILATFAALLRISQIESSQRRSNFERLDLSDVVATVGDIYQPALEDRGQTLEVHAPQGLLVQGDKALLTQMLANLVENASRHCPLGTRIAIDAGAGSSGAWLSITDDGPGIPAEHRQAVLERFYRLEPSRTSPGNGLGLSLVKAVVDLHEASMVLEDGRPGLKVQIGFPRASDPS
ncbi:TPA: sensor histidine kinase [Stenotrophomonas maltophilia]